MENIFKLAEEYHKSKWGYAILGVVVYYLSILLFGIITSIVVEIVSPGFIDTFNETLFGFLMLPFGILICYILYKYLEKTWKNNDPSKNNNLDEIGKVLE